MAKKLICVFVFVLFVTLPVFANQLQSDFKTTLKINYLDMTLTNNFWLDYTTSSDMAALDLVVTADWLPYHISKTFQVELAQLYYTKDLGVIQLTGGRKQIGWGPGYYSGLVLSKTSPSLDLFSYELEYKGFKYQRLYSMLDWKTDKQLQGQRLEVNFFPNLIFGLTETAVTVGKIDPLFYNPIPLWPIYLSQHLVTPNDAEQILYRVNIGISADVAYQLKDGMMIYGELFVDDSPQHVWEKIMDKRAGLAGIHISKLTDYADLRIEYARMHNYLYSHRNKAITYTKGDEMLGHIGGPDSDHLIVESNLRLNDAHDLILGFNYHQQGEGTIDVDWQDDPNWGEHQFLSGVVEKTREFKIGLRNGSKEKENYLLTLTYYLKDNSEHVSGQHDHGYRVMFQTNWDFNQLLQKVTLF